MLIREALRIDVWVIFIFFLVMGAVGLMIVLSGTDNIDALYFGKVPTGEVEQ